jgi:hypothetical protein
MKPETPDITLFERVMLVDCIFQQIQELINYTDTNNLLNVVAKFRMIKKREYYWKVNREYSLKCYADAVFKKNLDSLPSRLEEQLSLHLEHCKQVTDVSALGNAHTRFK